MRRTVVLTTLSLFAQVLPAQVITTIAGTSWIFPSNTQGALTAPLGQISGVAIDSHGNIFLADPDNALILEVAPGGSLTVYAGNGKQGHSGDGGPAVNASINPTDLAVDANGNLYIQDQAYIRMVTPAGTISTIAGAGVFGFSGDNGPATNAAISGVSGMITDAAGNLYFADTLNNRVRKISNGVITTIAGNGTAGFAGDGGPAASAELNQPAGLAFDSFGNLYIGDSLNHRIREVSTAGNITTAVGGASQFNTPSNLAADAKGANLYISDSGANLVYQYALGTKTLAIYAGTNTTKGAFAGDGGPAAQARLNSPAGLAVDASGNVYIADSGNFRLRAVSPTSLKIATSAGNGSFRFAGDGGQAINAQLNSPAGMAFDSQGNLYFADTANNRIRMVTPAGVISTVAGNGIPGDTGDGATAKSASLNAPTDVALDGSGNLYIADAGNSAIRKVALSTGNITTIAGGGTSTSDGIPAITASLLDPVAVAVDSAGNVYIAQASGNKVSIVKSGQISTFAGQASTFGGFAGDGGPAAGAALNSPEGLAFDTAGNLYIADTGNNRVRKVTTAGIISTVAGNGNSTPGPDTASAPTSVGIMAPAAVALDGSGDIFIAEADGRVREVANGVIQTIAGGGPATVLGDGGKPVGAGINQPEGLAVDGSGNVVIADTGNDRIRKVIGNATPGTQPPPPTALPTWAISASSLTFTQTLGGAALPSQTVNLTPTASASTPAVNGLNFTVATDSGSSAWLSLNINSGSMPAALVVTVNPSSLAPGTYNGTITISAPNTANPTASISVTLTVPQPPPQPSLSLDTQQITFTAPLQSAPLTSQFHVLNTGGGTLNFTSTVTSSGGSWLSISPASGAVTPSGPVAVVATAAPASLSPGTYTGSIVISGAGNTATIPVTLTVSGPSATLLVSESGITFTAVSGGGAPLPHDFGILNTGSGSMDWTATASTLSNGSFTTGASWLSVTPSSGTVVRPFLDVSLVNVSVDPSSLAPGTYFGRIEIDSPEAVNTPALITVTVNVLQAGLNPGPQIYPTGLIFTGVAGATPGSQTVQVANPSGSVNSFESGVIPSINPAFSFLPLNATLGSSQPTKIEVYPNLSQLSAGSQQRGTITLQFTDGSPSQTVNVLVVVAPSGTPADSDSVSKTGGPALEPHASGCTPTSLTIVFHGIQPGFNAVVGQGTNVDAQITDSCGNLVGTSGQSAKAFATINGTTINMNQVGNGIWQATWTPSSAGNASVTVTSVLQVSGFNLITANSTTINGTVTSVAQNTGTTTGAPLTSAVTHAASQAPGLPISPGELITVYGANLAAGAQASNTLPLPTSANGLQVLLGVTPLPILYTSSGQMNVQVPYSVPLNTQYQLSVVSGNSLSVPQTLTVAAAVPGIFTVNQQGTGQGVIVKSDGITLAQAGTPASIGETITIYCTGLGVVSPAATEGVPPTGAASTVNPVTVTIGGANAAVAYAGVTPGFPGLYQVNAVVPSGIATGDSVPVLITEAGQSSQTVTIAVH